MPDYEEVLTKLSDRQEKSDVAKIVGAQSFGERSRGLEHRDDGAGDLIIVE